MPAVKCTRGLYSYDIILKLVKAAVRDTDRPFIILDLTYGRGRFYRRVAAATAAIIYAVDVVRHEWEVKPNVFFNCDAIKFVDDVVNGKLNMHADIVVVDPPWNHEKRGYLPKRTGISCMPYHMRVKSIKLIEAATKLACYLNAKLIYRYKCKLECTHILYIPVEVSMFGNKGVVHYGLCEAKNC